MRATDARRWTRIGIQPESSSADLSTYICVNQCASVVPRFLCRLALHRLRSRPVRRRQHARKMAGDKVSARLLGQRRLAFGTDRLCSDTACAEAAATGQMHRTRRLACQMMPHVAHARRRVRYRRQQRYGVRMQRRRLDRLARCHFNDATQIHHRDPIGDVADHREAVRDENIGQTQDPASDRPAGSAPAPAPKHPVPTRARLQRSAALPIRAHEQCQRVAAGRRTVHADTVWPVRATDRPCPVYRQPRLDQSRYLKGPECAGLPGSDLGRAAVDSTHQANPGR